MTVRPSQAPAHLSSNRVLLLLLLEPFTGCTIMSRAELLRDEGEHDDRRKLASKKPRENQHLLEFNKARIRCMRLNVQKRFMKFVIFQDDQIAKACCRSIAHFTHQLYRALRTKNTSRCPVTGPHSGARPLRVSQRPGRVYINSKGPARCILTNKKKKQQDLRYTIWQV